MFGNSYFLRLVILLKASIFAQSTVYMKCPDAAFMLIIQGLVQGVGFRPFIYRLATEIGIKGEVDNRNDGVYIQAMCSSEKLQLFISRIKKELPVVAHIHQIQVCEIDLIPDYYTRFSITPSRSSSTQITQVAPDIAVCPACLEDRKLQSNRIQYPFINCTHCGPRFSIIQDLPYDRSKTTMSAFSMCIQCGKEYKDIQDRRFHAQPLACNACGPFYYADYNHNEITDYEILLNISVDLLKKGEVIAVKGMGGYHLVCDAMNEEAVVRLRAVKIRDRKPFAVMFKDFDCLKTYASVNVAEEKCLLSWRRPIVLLKQLRTLASQINPRMKTLGCLLPYMPVHYDWFDRLNTPALVMTSGNVSDSPIAITSSDAENQLKDKVPFLLHHNRDIYNRVDDSVLQVCGNQPCLIRRSRGYAPEPLFTDDNMEGILAFGAEKVNTFALGKGNTVLQSQYIGDLKNWETFQFYTQAMEHFKRLFRFTPVQLVCDLHPDYFSSQEADRMAESLHIPLLRVQHHHAHAVSCMLEYGIVHPVVAIVWDGTGLGDDGKSWGGEIFYCDRSRYERLSHIEYVPLPGGDKASAEPWRMAVAWLWHYFGTSIPFPSGFVDRIGASKIKMMIKMMEKGVNSPYTSSAGRLFDAIASLLNICDVSTYQAEAPIRLEQAAGEEQHIHYKIKKNGDSIVFYPLFKGILEDLAKGIAVGEIAARFHNSLSYFLMDEVKQLLKKTGAKEVILAGGCFQNKRLTEQLQRLFSSERIPLYIPSRVPCNDGGIAVGQMAIAAARREIVLNKV